MRSPTLQLLSVAFVSFALLSAPAVANAGHRYRTIDGTGNNRGQPEMGATDTPLLRLAPAAYADGVSTLAGPDRPSAREVSNGVNAQPRLTPARRRASDFLWQWGQFLDHDIDLGEGADPQELAPIPVPAGDPFFDPWGTGSVVIPFARTIYDRESEPRQQINQITAWIDASNVYGSDPVRAEALRTNDGTGRMRTSEGALLPWNDVGLPNAGGSGPDLFLAGDIRANEQVGLTAMHTLFVREHNRWAGFLGRLHRRWSGEQIYQKARQIVGAEMQVITYREFLPALLGRRALRPYRGYRRNEDGSIANEFSTVAYRFGHSALNPQLLRLARNGSEIPEGHLPLRDSFFAPERITEEGGIAPLLRGLAAQRAQRIDAYVVDDVRNFLFGPPGSGGFDLVSLNIQRGRDHGMPGYNDLRRALGFEPAADFDDISSDPEIVARLAATYESVEQVDAWVGGLSEDHVRRSHLGPLFHEIIVNQFEALRDADRYWYTRVLSRWERIFIEHIRLADVIRANTGIGREISRDVFRVRRSTRR